MSIAPLKNKILKEYKQRAGLYQEFTRAVSCLLESMLNKSGYKYHISSRVKEIRSLENKIIRKKLKGKIYKKLKDIQDIAGVRIIFYTEHDRKKFIGSIEKEFKTSLKMKKTFKLSGYRAIHAILHLGPERLRLAEYKAFGGLPCEIQLCLILEHAWAEIEHDILYKENRGYTELDRLRHLFMKERMERIMKNQINNASKEIERIVSQSKKIKRGQRLARDMAPT